jgi:hypothetical protein
LGFLIVTVRVVATRPSAVLWAALLPILLAAPVAGVLAQTEKTPQELRTADDEFSRQLSELNVRSRI